MLIGNCDVGKSSTFIRFRDNRFDDYIQSTVGLDFTAREVKFRTKKTDISTEKTATVSIPFIYLFLQGTKRKIRILPSSGDFFYF